MNILEKLHKEIVESDWTKYFKVINLAEEQPSLFTTSAEFGEEKES